MSLGVFEDSLFALETAKRAGFMTFGVKDSSNVHQWDDIRTISDYYIESFTGGINS